MIWETRGHTFDFTQRGAVMGILNVTPDSFSDGGRFALRDAAMAHCERLLKDGADVLDIGGESTRPGAQTVVPEEEIQRTVPIIAGLRAAGVQTAISIDTRKAAVAQEALAAGAGLINDVPTVQELMDRIMSEADSLIKERLAGL